MSQSTLGGRTEKWWRSIVKDAYSTRDGGGDTRLEVAVWQIDKDTYIPPDEGREGVEDPIKTVSGNLRYDKILGDAIDELGSPELSRRTGLKSYRDEQGGRAASTIRGYQQNDEWWRPKDEGGYRSSHPIKRVLRRYARSQDKGHFEEDASGDERVALPPRSGKWIDGQIDMEALHSAFRLARSIASQNGFVFAPQSGDGEAVEDNERIDRDEVRPVDRPLGDTKGAVLLTKPSGSVYEYEVDFDKQTLIPVEGMMI